jgi:hypothetical protein
VIALNERKGEEENEKVGKEVAFEKDRREKWFEKIQLGMRVIWDEPFLCCRRIESTSTTKDDD